MDWEQKIRLQFVLDYLQGLVGQGPVDKYIDFRNYFNFFGEHTWNFLLYFQSQHLVSLNIKLPFKRKRKQ